MDHDPQRKKAELLAIAKQAGVKGRHRMTKKQLLEALEHFAKTSGAFGNRVPSSAPPAGSAPEAAPSFPSASPPGLQPLLGESRIALLPQGPRTAFAYWETGDEGSGDLALEVSSAPDGARIARHAVAGRTGSFYLHLDRSGLTIEAILGTVKEGRFRPVLRSNRIRLPDDSPSEELPEFRMTRKDGFFEISPISQETITRWASRVAGGDGLSGHPSSSWPGSGGKVVP